MMKRVPQWVRDLSPDLLIHSYWDTAPPPSPSPVGRALARVRALPDRMRTWSQLDWLYFILFVSAGIGVITEFIALTRAVHRNDG